MSKVKKWIILCMMLLSMLMLVGWGIKYTPILKSDKCLIDLDAAIREVDIGKQGNTALKPEEVIPAKKEAEYTISIRDTQIYLNKLAYKDAETLAAKLKRDCKRGEQVNVQDDYAEAHVYKEVLKLLEELKKSNGINYTYD